MRFLPVTAVVLLSLCCLHGQAEAKQCVRFEESPLRQCAKAGYNYTYALPDGLSDQTTRSIVNSLSEMSKAMVNCSVAQIAEAIACMSYAPKCVDADEEPLLPCRRVCSEFLKRCSGTIKEWMLEWIISRCLVLPDATAESGKCFEPKQFNKHFNANTTGPLEQGCQKLVYFPFCEGLGYTYTIPTPEKQLQIYQIFYRKNITEGDKTKPTNNSVLQTIIQRMQITPKCGKSIHKLFCADILPPCFPPQGQSFYTVCQPVCKSIGEQCPEAFEDRLGIYFRTCERMAPGNTSHGFCKHTKLPPIIDWYDYWADPPTSPPSKGLSTTTIIVISVVVPAVVVAIIITMIIVLIKRKKSDLFNYRSVN